MMSMLQTATAVGFDPDLDYRGYQVQVLSPFILEDRAVASELDKNWRRELREAPGKHSHPDDILHATLVAFTETEKAAIRRRVLYAFERWDRE